MKRTVFAFLLVVGMAAAAAVPRVSNITVDFQTNVSENVFASIGVEHVKTVWGDVNRVVEPGARTINWDASEIWPGHKFRTPSVKARVTVWPTNAPPDWLAVDLTSADCSVTYYASEAALPWGRISGNPKYKGDVLLMRKIPASHVLSFIGSPETEANHLAGRETRRMCTLTNDFYIGIYPLTFRQFYLLNDGPSSTETRLAPVYNQSYNMLRYHRDNAASTPRPVNFPTTSRTFVGGNSRIRDWRTRTGLELDLPTSAQWEIACRAGTDGPTYAALNLICNPNAGAAGYEVGLYQPNSWQLYDMIGNRYEFCLDYFSDNITSEAVTDPLGATSDASFRRVIRGTYHTGTYSTHMRAAFFTGSADINQGQAYGFRLCITLP